MSQISWLRRRTRCILGYHAAARAEEVGADISYLYVIMDGHRLLRETRSRRDKRRDDRKDAWRPGELTPPWPAGPWLTIPRRAA